MPSFSSEIIQYAVWLHYRFNLSYRDVEDLLAELGIIVSFEAIRLWCNKFGPQYAQYLKLKGRGFGDTFYIDEVFVKISGKQQYLWCAVDQDGDVIDVFQQERRNSMAVKRFLKCLMVSNQGESRRIVTDKLGSYRVTHRELITDVIHDTSQYANNKAELSHQSTRVRERGMRRFKSIAQAQRFLTVNAVFITFSTLVGGWYRVSASNYLDFREGAFNEWREAAG